jgi:ABC-type sugar transport system ATPase subunit
VTAIDDVPPMPEPLPPGAVPVAELCGVSKSFGHVQALEAVDFQVWPREVVALVGDNGAGKSTLIKILAGVYEPTSGDVRVDGDRVTFRHPADAVKRGISTVYQDLALVDGRTVAANLFLGQEFTRGPFVDRKRIVAEARTVVRSLRADIPSVDVPVYMLSGGQRQAVAIGRAVVQGGRVIVMDEPTASLGVAEVKRVLDLVTELRAQGRSVVLISHNLNHVWQVADRIVVLHRGHVAGTVIRAEAAEEDVVRLILFGDPTRRLGL